MANFLIQTINNQIKHDFCFALVEAIEYQNWLHKGLHDYHLSDNLFDYDFSNYIPCGTIQFIEKFLATYHDKHTIKPINIPMSLMKEEFLKRDCNIVKRRDIDFNKEMFIKSCDRLKGFTSITNNINDIPETSENYLVSDLIDIDSEWRSFVFDGELVGIQNYLGDFTLFPDISFINKCISIYKDAPPAYTLDIGINKKNGCFVIEVHNFYSCGLYGFNNSKIIPQMFLRSFNHLLKNGY